jgi:hypothetical protein
VFALATLAALLAPSTIRAASPELATAESLYAAGRFAAAEPMFARLAHTATNDTLIELRLASLHLLRDDRVGARAILEPMLARGSRSRTVRSLLAESHVRDLSFAKAVPHERALGRESFAKQLESFAGKEPYRLAGPASTTIRFVQTDPLPLVEARIGDRTYFFLIDTGAAELVVDASLVDSLHLPRYGEEEGTFAGGRKRPYLLTRVSSFTLGDFTFTDLPATSVDLSRFAAAAGGRTVSGIIGTLLFMRCRATLDYPGGALMLERTSATANAQSESTDSSRVTLPLWIARDHYLLTLGRIGKAPESLWFVDTGLAGAAITAPETTLIEAGFPVPDTSSASNGMGGGGPVKIRPFPVDRFALGGTSQTGLYGVYGAFPATLERGFGYRIAGIISHAYLRAYRVTFDFAAHQLVLQKPATAARGG